MPLETILQQSDFAGLTAGQAREKLSEIVDLPHDTTRYSWATISERLEEIGVPIEVRAVWDSVLTEFEGGTMLDRQLSSKDGIDLSRQPVQDQLAAVRQSINQADRTALTDEQIQRLEIAGQVIDALIAIGRPTGPRWQKEGLAELPTLENVEGALVAIEKQAALNVVMQAYEAAAEEYRKAESTPASIKQAALDVIGGG